MDIWNFQTRLTRRLGIWAGLNLAAGTFFALGFTRKKDPALFLQAFGAQAAGWGFINGMIAVFGSLSARKRRQSPLSSPEQERTQLRKLLWINTGLDVFYMAGGLGLAKTRGLSDRGAAGHGWGIFFQGAFLFVFDLIHAWKLERRHSL